MARLKLLPTANFLPLLQSCAAMLTLCCRRLAPAPPPLCVNVSDFLDLIQTALGAKKRELHRHFCSLRHANPREIKHSPIRTSTCTTSEMSAANAGMTDMEQAMENLRNSPLRPDQVTKIQRMARVDKLQVDRARALHQPAACIA